MSEIEKIAELKRRLELEKERLQEKIEEINLILQLIDESLREKSFIPAEKLLKEEKVGKIPQKVPKRELDLLRFRGEVVLKGEVTPDSIKIYVDPKAKIPVDSGPIRYLVRLFDRFVDEDLRSIKQGALSIDKKFTYIIDEEEGYLTKIEIINYNTNERLKDILSKIRWAVKTLLKESMKSET